MSVGRVLRIFGLFASIILFLISSFVAFLPQKAVAAGETYRWTSNTTVVANGSDLQGDTTFTASAPAIPTFYATMTHKTGCQFRVQMIVNANNTSGLLLLQQASGGSDGITNRCSAPIQESYNAQTVPIQGTRPSPPGGAPETPLQKEAKLLLYSPTPAAQSPQTVTFVWKNAAGQTIATTSSPQRSDPNTTDPNNQVVRYTTTTTLEPGNYSVCPSAIVGCQNFTKVKYQSASLTYGESLSARDIEVTLQLAVTRAEKDPFSAGPVELSLQKADGTGPVIKTQTDNYTTPGIPSGTATINSTITLRGKFTNVEAGTYKVCVVATNTCTTVTKDSGNNATITIPLSGAQAQQLTSVATAPPDKTCAQEAKGIGWLACPIIATLEQASAKLTELIVSLLDIRTEQMFEDAETSAAYKTAWAGFRNIAYAILVIVGLVMVASQVFNIELLSAYTLRKMLPSLIIAVIFVTFSWELVKFLYYLSNDAALALTDIIRAPFLGVNSVAGEIGDNTGQSVFGAAILFILGPAGIAAVGIYAALGGIGVILALVASLLLTLFSIFVLLEARQVAAVMILIFSSIAIMCAAFEPTKKVFTFWKGLLIVIIITVPAVAGILTMAGVASLIAAKPGGPLDLLTGFIILIAGFVMVWTLFLQMDKITGFLGNIANKATGKAQQALAGYRSNTIKRNFGLWKEGGLQNRFGKATRELGEQFGAAEHVSQSSGQGFLGAMKGSAEGQKALEHIRRKRSLKLLENDMGANAGNDDFMEVLADLNPKNEHEAAEMLYNLRKKRFDQRQAHYKAATGRELGEKWDHDKEHAAAHSEAVSAQETFGHPIGGASMRGAAARALLGSSTAFNDIATRYQTYRKDEAGNLVLDADGKAIGNGDGLRTKEGNDAMFRRIERITGKMKTAGIMTEIDTTQAIKKNTQRSEMSGNSFAQVMMQTRKTAERITELRQLGITDAEIDQLEDITLSTIVGLQRRGVSSADIASVDATALTSVGGLSPETVKRLQLDRGAVAGALGVVAKLRAKGVTDDKITKLDLINEDEITSWVDKSIEYTSAGQRGQRGESVDVQGSHLLRKLQKAVADSSIKAAAAEPAVVASKTEVDRLRPILQAAMDAEAIVINDPNVGRDVKETALENTRKAKAELDAAANQLKAAQAVMDSAQQEVIRVMAIGSAEQQAALYRNPDAVKKLDAVFSSMQMPGQPPGVTVGAHMEYLRQYSDTMARLERSYRQGVDAAQAAATTPPPGAPPGPMAGP